MADATFQDVLEETKRTNEILKQNAKETQKVVEGKLRDFLSQLPED